MIDRRLQKARVYIGITAPLGICTVKLHSRPYKMRKGCFWGDVREGERERERERERAGMVEIYLEKQEQGVVKLIILIFKWCCL